MIHPPPTRYARRGDARIAYQVIGEGPDLIVVGGPASHLDLEWEEPATVRGFERVVDALEVVEDACGRAAHAAPTSGPSPAAR